MTMSRLLSLAALTLSLGGPASAIEGRYRVEGANPGSPQPYRGEAIIRKTGATYSIVWQIGSARQVGTGLLTGNVLSVAFNTVGENAPGAASFAVVNDRVTGGSWTLIGASVVGTERWTAE